MQNSMQIATRTQMQSQLYRNTGPGPSGSARTAQQFSSTMPDGVAFGASMAAPSRLITSGAYSRPRDEHVISSQNRYKYFKRPVIPFMNMQPPEVLFAPVGGQSALEPPQKEPEPMVKDAGLQSIYREADAQTDPYTPDYIVPAGTNPELLTLASLKFGAGLPAGLAEVQMIERARAKREFEASLPPITDEASFELRRKMMGEQEMREWNVREEEIHTQQDEKLAAFESRLRAEHESLEGSWDERIEHARQMKLTEKDKEISAIQRRRIKTLRKLSEARNNIEPKREKVDVVNSYADYGSEVYAPLARNGRITRDKLADRYDTRALEFTSLSSLQELERSLPTRALHAPIVRPDKGKPKGYAARAEAKLLEQLNRTDAAIRAAKQAKPSERESKEALLASYRAVKPIERPPTPSVAEAEAEAEVEVACVLLQRLLRGRAIQNMMFAGKERHAELIAELRCEEADADDSKSDEDAEGAAAEGLGGDMVGTSLDAMSKELRRFKEERRIAEIVRVAQATRRVREAEESGRRQREMLRRAEQQEAFRQLMRAHNASANLYVSELLAAVCTAKASEQAQADARAKLAERMGPNGQLADSHLSPLLLAADVVDNFTFPEVQRQQAWREADRDLLKFTRATASALDAAVADVDAYMTRLAESTL
mmetsp:Transcript_7500/g.16538  ORF Transcript_7500/g.16538 Transcript_7500/m.16538 type:complete len:658 (-) Transcript_7500:157-2130(-)